MLLNAIDGIEGREREKERESEIEREREGERGWQDGSESSATEVKGLQALVLSLGLV